MMNRGTGFIKPTLAGRLFRQGGHPGQGRS